VATDVVEVPVFAVQRIRVGSLNWTVGGNLAGISEVFIHPDFNEQ
jgi:hypothetical protein